MKNKDGIAFEKVLQMVRTQQPELYRAWFDELGAVNLRGGELLVTVSDPTRASYLREQCTHAFSDAATMLSGRLLPVRFVGDGDGTATQAVSVITRMPLNPDYTFDQFVVGTSNRLAHAACRAICTQLGSLYNPLFIHGKSGLGKSHLLQATCDAIARTVTGIEITYVSCESFINDLVRALENGSLTLFREEARRADVLVIDDVQFLANRDQEEIFHTFNALYQGRRQIILSADLPPSEIPTLEDRLVSRFNWGVVAQIDPPNREMRHAILLKKARLRGANIPDDVLELIAERCDANIRTLEGALSKLIVDSLAANRPITLESAHDLLATMAGTQRKAILINDVLEAVSEHFGIRLAEIVGRKRTKSVVVPRQVGMYLARRLTPLSLEEIGAHFGGRDHATVLHAERIVEEALQANAPTQTIEAVATLSRRLSR